MLRKLHRIIWFAALCLQVSTDFGQTLPSDAATQPCDKDCEQKKVDALFKKIDQAYIKQRSSGAEKSGAGQAEAANAAAGSRRTAYEPDINQIAQYVKAIQSAVNSHWVGTSSLSKEPCLVHITQLPGGEVINAEADASCPYDDRGRKAVEDAVRQASPLPYKGFENVFRRRIDFAFRA